VPRVTSPLAYATSLLHSHLPHVIYIATSTCPVSCHVSYVLPPRHATSSSIRCHDSVHIVPHQRPYSATSTFIKCHVNICTFPCQHPYNAMLSSILPRFTLPRQHSYCHVSPCHMSASVQCHVSLPIGPTKHENAKFD
jgi:hypothetical protein